MNWLIFLFVFEIGVVPQNNFVMYERHPQIFEYEGEYYYPISIESGNRAPILYTDLGVEFRIIDIYYISGSVRISTVWAGESFDPQALYYDFVCGARFGSIDVFWRHACRHPQMTYMFNYTPLHGWEGAYDEIAIRVGGQAPLIKGKKRT